MSGASVVGVGFRRAAADRAGDPGQAGYLSGAALVKAVAVAPMAIVIAEVVDGNVPLDAATIIAVVVVEASVIATVAVRVVAVPPVAVLIAEVCFCF